MLSGHHEVFGLRVFFFFFLANYGIATMSRSSSMVGKHLLFFFKCAKRCIALIFFALWGFRLGYIVNFLMSPLGYVLHHLTCRCRDLPTDCGCSITELLKPHTGLARSRRIIWRTNMTDASRKATFFMFAQTGTNPEMSHTFMDRTVDQWDQTRQNQRKS